MNDIREMIVDTTARIMKDLVSKETVNNAEKGIWPGELWDILEEMGLTMIGIPEEQGGAGGSYGDALSALKIAGKYSAPIPLAETLIANWLLHQLQFDIKEGSLTLTSVSDLEAIQFEQTADSWYVTGSAQNVPWARFANEIIVIGTATSGTTAIGVVYPQDCTVIPGQNLAGEARDRLIFNRAQVKGSVRTFPNLNEICQWIWFTGALTRIVLMSGALERILELSVTYSKERKQFGQHIGKFQAIQHQLAVLSGEVVAANLAANYAIEAFEDGDGLNQIMLAKARVSEAVGTAVPIAHQVHGAIGFTHEHPLHHSTRRLWSWRDEFGHENEWSDRLGEYVMQAGPNHLWSFISS
ncbi:acyl-CoA dehydrogenase [Caldalkalibacillus uzonensis]|uniref:Acyl-CoA dehydrogenase n=1 Tax=Caldalkalibacillus uzonensis TaxID=353224 RepID=A0ABU0CXF0_9BACI|nr:acyl-CoA dehydrogenase family protein [Caldalkalibacillus uzonensis]MDQ0340831.1 acyl-CoA dehydrogenase [Caldalkalibacillus uzonensis]